MYLEAYTSILMVQKERLVRQPLNLDSLLRLLTYHARKHSTGKG